MRTRNPLFVLLAMMLVSCGSSSGESELSSSGNPGESSSSMNESSTSTALSETGSQSSNPSSSLSSVSLPSFTVTFVTNATATLNPITTSVIDFPPAVSNDPYMLEGWYLDASFTQVVVFPYTVTAPVTFYAKWIEGTPGINFQINASLNGYIAESYGGNATQIAIPSSYQGLPVVELGAYLFYDNGAITSVSLPSTLKTVGYAAFKNAIGLTSIVLPNSVTHLASDAFAGATNLTTISFSTSLSVIGNNAFENTKLSSIQLPASLTEINARSFANNALLQSVTLLGTNPPIRFPSSFENCHSALRFHVPSQALATYQSDASWAAYSSIIVAI